MNELLDLTTDGYLSLFMRWSDISSLPSSTSESPCAAGCCGTGP